MLGDNSHCSQTLGRSPTALTTRWAPYVRFFVSVFHICYRNPLLFLLLLISFSLATLTALYQEQKRLLFYTGDGRQTNTRLPRAYDAFATKIRQEELIRSAACSLPKIDPFHKSIMKNMKDYGKLDCPGTMYSSLDGKGHILRVQGKNISRVSMTSVVRPHRNDFSFKFGKTYLLPLKPGQLDSKRLETGYVGCLQHVTGLCVHPFGGFDKPTDGTKVVLHSDCGLARTYFVFEESGLIRHKDSGKCLQPRGSAEDSGNVLELSGTCNLTTSTFGMTKHGAMQHKASGLCVQPKNPENPMDDEGLILRMLCDEDSSVFQRFGEKGFVASETFSNVNLTHAVNFDFVQVKIRQANGKINKEFHAQVFPKANVLERPIKSQGMGLDVIMIMFDSTSEAQFRRKLPKTRTFLEKELETIFFEGESIVGDGTTAQLSAMLSGIAEEDQPEARRGRPGAEPVDKWRWIFSDYSNHGYATLFSEDDPALATFNLRLMGFQEPPTDHYARPFWLALEKYKRHSESHRFCIKAQKIHQLTFRYLNSFQESYRDRPKFSLAILSDLTHGDENALSYADEDFLEFLKILRNSSHLNHSIVVVFGDHGYRFGKYRELMQGKLEERLPHLSITVPSWFSKKFPEISKNLQHNAKVLTSPFDVYATLKHVISFPENPAGVKTGQSLFTRIEARNRTCAHVGIAPHWCPCMEWERVGTGEPVVQNIGQAVVHYLNNLIASGGNSKDLCYNLTLKRINNAVKQMPKTEVQTFQETRRTKHCDSCVAIFGGKSVDSLDTNTVYQIRFVVAPSDGLLEATVTLRDEGIFINPGDISRINAYGDKSYCIRKTHPHLLKYCSCRDAPSKEK